MRFFTYFCHTFLIDICLMRKLISLLLMPFLLLSCADGKVKSYRLEVVAEFPHDIEAYTQGLFFDNGNLYESTGRNGQSSFRRVDLETGEVLHKMSFSNKYFVEGSVMFEAQCINDYIQEYNSTAKYDFILTKMGGNMLYANEAMDITKYVVKGLNEKYTSNEKK